MRELIADHELRYMWTLTFATAPSDRRAITRAWKNMSQNLGRRGCDVARLGVTEVGEGGRPHVHVATSLELTRAQISGAWTAGRVHLPDLEQATVRGALEKIGGYLVKEFATAEPAYRRFWTGGGIKIQEERFRVASLEEGLALGVDRFGTEPLKVFQPDHSRLYADFPPAARR